MTNRHSKYYSEVFRTTRKHLLQSRSMQQRVASHDYNAVSVMETLSAQPVGFYPEESDYAYAAELIDDGGPSYPKDPTEIMMPAINSESRNNTYSDAGSPAGVETAYELPEQRTVVEDTEEPAEQTREVEEVPEPPVERAREDEFLQDLRSIISGKKTRENTGRKGSDKEPHGTENSQERSSSGKKSEDRHEIFDKIAQSMRFANAYDLGPVELEKRFDDFDRTEESLSTGSKPSMKKKEDSRKRADRPVLTKAEKTDSGQGEDSGSEGADQKDFIEDLDLIKDAVTPAPEDKVSTGGETPGAVIGDTIQTKNE